MSAILEFRTAPGKPVLRGHAFFWSVIRELGAEGGLVSVHAVLQRTNRTERSTVADYFRRLEAAGIIEDSGERETLHKGRDTPLYKLLKTPLATPRVNRDGTPAQQGRGQQHMWNVLRGPESRGGLTADDLALRAATEEIPVSVHSAKAFLKRLNAAGYLAQVKHGLWKLKPAMDTGPLAPLILKTKVVYDQNLREAQSPLEAEEDRP
ncbi:hypothetical protein [Jiella pacifica]|uniref:Uncharacterized protein n=1 Tax=Jiella pacifica TaxID=2696469 RepID=A0A6N9SY70_9HYPH|nr:hypothetical protein [Jiella pacifica]NDW04043.1 hypothetical protein [Jiella pacifica]